MKKSPYLENLVILVVENEPAVFAGLVLLSILEMLINSHNPVIWVAS